MVTHDQLDAHLRVLLEETGDLTGEDHAREKRINIDPKAPAHNDGCAGRPRRRLLNAIEMRPDLLVKAPSLISERHRAGSPLEQSDADTALKACNGAPNPRGCQPKGLRGTHHRSGLHYGHQHRYAGKQTAIVRHGIIQDFKSLLYGYFGVGINGRSAPYSFPYGTAARSRHLTRHRTK